MSIAMAQDSADAQSSSAQRETSLPSSITAVERSGDNQSTSLRQGSVDQKVTNPCSLRAPDNISQSPAMGKQASMTIGTFAYTPLSAHCKFHLFLKSTYSPYTFASAGFQATWAHAMGQWPHYGGGAQGWAKRFGATLADTESRRFIHTFALSTILQQDPRYFPSRKRMLISRYGIQQPGWWLPRMTAAIAHSTALSFWALCSPVHYKPPTTRDMTEMSGTP